MNTRFFFDTEFIEDGRTIELISIGIVDHDGRSYYACNRDCDLSRANGFVRDHVLPHLPPKGHAYFPIWKPRAQIRDEILAFVGDRRPEFWAYYADYDWIALCQLFGRMVDLPKGWPMYCRDIKQLADSRGSTEIPIEPPTPAHHALADAVWAKRAYEYLAGLSSCGQ